ncbi:hypothetical protein [Peptostreptococcus faecalis]|uniref:hypothetical protein n=1 Tax=Peptostreptococcus faecalis TaxID=2045015 RepID=UPI000C7D5402|nr:hypothetical protein [Peptostreptococcus faecalis]
MKKTNFIVTFCLLISLISFVGFLINFSEFWRNISFLIIPSVEEYDLKTPEIYRSLITNIPMLIFTGVTFCIGVKKGIKLYKSSNE